MIILFVLIGFLAVGPVSAKILHVSPEGPITSLHAARDAIRAMKRAGLSEPVTVLIRGGVYTLTEPFVLRPEDSGTPQHPVTYSAAPGERVIVSGGRTISKWQKGPGAIFTTQVSGVKEGRWYFRQLFVNGRRAARARTPNLGYFRIDGPSSLDKPFALKYHGDNIRKAWEGRKDAEVVVLLEWTEIRRPILRVDEAAHVAKLAGDAGGTGAIIPKELDARYFVENTPDSLDSPSEWFLDRETGTLSYWPAGGEDLSKHEVVAPVLQQLVRLDGEPEKGQWIRNVTFRGIHFRYADWTMPPQGYGDAPQAAVQVPAAFQAIGAENCGIEECSFAQVGGYAISFGRASKRNRVQRSHIFDIGAGGIKIGEKVMRPDTRQQTVENVITDNNIHNLGLVYPEAVGVWIGQSSRNTISHNIISDLFYTAISIGWVWGYGPAQCAENRIEYNHLHHIGKYTLNDLGAVYTLGAQPRTVIRNNLVHDVTSRGERGRGIYLDEGSAGLLVENNVVYHCKSAGFHQHYGRDNVVRNNIFAFNQEAQFSRAKAEPHRSYTFERNIVYFDNGTLMAGSWADNQTQVNRNLYFDARGGEIHFAGAPFSAWRARGHDRDSIIADPLFTNAERYDFRLLSGSPAARIGFVPINLSAVGPRSSRLRGLDKLSGSPPAPVRGAKAIEDKRVAR